VSGVGDIPVGDCRGLLRTGYTFEMGLIIVEITVHGLGRERDVVEWAWHRGNGPLERVRNIAKKPLMVLPP
jgi:hypothetical protein